MTIPAHPRTAILILLLAATHAAAVEHPGIVPQNVDCSSCHARQMTGRSVHSAMATSCTVCHVTRTQGDMTMLSLAMPKEQICFACHEKNTALKQHIPAVEGSCVDCHDSHSSDQRMLLLKAPPAPTAKQKRN